MIVTLDVFSGRPNPAWILSARDARKLITRLAGKAMTAPEAVEPKLGYRGFLISAGADDDAENSGLPEAFRIGVGAPEALVAPRGLALPALTADEAEDAARWLLTTAGQAASDDLLNTVREMMAAHDAAETRKPRTPRNKANKTAGGGAGGAVAAANCVIRDTAYNPAFWNAPATQPHNNCYNYAMNYRSNTLAQPGRISGHPNSVMQCADVAAAANFDGCTANCVGPNKSVALVVWPGQDFHWYRLHTNGFWGHKPGQTAARNTDNQGRVIGGALNPQNCNRGPYTAFCGYRFSPVGMRVQ